MRWGILSALAALMICASPAGAQGGRIAFDLDGDIWTMRADGSERTRLTEGSGGLALSPDGTQIAFGRGNEPTSIWLRDFATGAERRISRSPSSSTVIDGEPDWASDGRSLVYARLRATRDDVIIAEVRNVDVQTGRQRKLTSTSSRRTLVFSGTPQFSPDGSRILYTLTKLDRRGKLIPS